MKTANAVKRGHFHVYLVVLLGLFSSRAASESNLLSVEDANELVIKSDASSSSRIVGGSPASPNQFPYQVAVVSSMFCGGSLITVKWVLTAAHCVYIGNQVVQPSQMQIIAGTVNLHTGGERRNVRRVIPHERYGNLRNDIAVLELAQNYKLSSSITTIALRRSTVPKASTVTISGWGRLSTNGPPSTEVLRYNQAIVLPPFGCQLETGFSTGVICLLSPVNNGACFGDSGGPAVYDNQLVGVTSFGYNGCGTSRSDVYTQVSDYVPWIEAKIK